MFGKGFDASVVLREGSLGYIGPGTHKKQIMFLGDDIYHVKQPHSKYYKNNSGDFGNASEALDNQFATATELLSEMRYKAFNIPYAHYESFRGNNGEFKLISKNIDNDQIEIRALAELFVYEDEFFERYSKKFSMQSLEEIITNPVVALRFMTPKCYDQFIKYSLASMFDFSNDEHFNNVIFIRNQNSMLFESMFLCDKESNVFNPLIARGFSLEDVFSRVNDYTEYAGIHIVDRDETFDRRVSILFKMIRNGTMPKKYVKFLSEYAGFDFTKAANEIRNRHDIVIDDRQLDVYKKSAEIAGEISQRGYWFLKSQRLKTYIFNSKNTSNS